MHLQLPIVKGRHVCAYTFYNQNNYTVQCHACITVVVHTKCMYFETYNMNFITTKTSINYNSGSSQLHARASMISERERACIDKPMLHIIFTFLGPAQKIRKEPDHTCKFLDLLTQHIMLLALCKIMW